MHEHYLSITINDKSARRALYRWFLVCHTWLKMCCYAIANCKRWPQLSSWISWQQVDGKRIAIIEQQQLWMRYIIWHQLLIWPIGRFSTKVLNGRWRHQWMMTWAQRNLKMYANLLLLLWNSNAFLGSPQSIHLLRVCNMYSRSSFQKIYCAIFGLLC